MGHSSARRLPSIEGPISSEGGDLREEQSYAERIKKDIALLETSTELYFYMTWRVARLFEAYFRVDAT
jgi:hypothetical protein